MNISWTTESCLGSGNLAYLLILTFDVDLVEPTKTNLINFKNADWNGFRDSSELAFGKCRSPKTVVEKEAKFRKVLIKATKWHITHGRIKEFRPYFPKQAAELYKTRDELQSINPGDPNFSLLNKEIDDIVNRHKRSKRIEFVNAVTHRGVSHKLWKIVNSLAGESADNTQTNR